MVHGKHLGVLRDEFLVETTITGTTGMISYAVQKEYRCYLFLGSRRELNGMNSLRSNVHKGGLGRAFRQHGRRRHNLLLLMLMLIGRRKGKCNSGGRKSNGDKCQDCSRWRAVVPLTHSRFANAMMLIEDIY